MKIAIVGYGKMGRVLEQVIHESDEHTAVVVGKEIDSDVYLELLANCTDADCVIDFSHISKMEDVLLFARENTKPLVVCTTGLNENQEFSLQNSAKKIPIVYAQNMSVGINVLLDVVRRVSAALGNNFDIELIEKHHNLKEDAPSGTATMLLSAIDGINEKTIVNGRKGFQKRAKNEIGVHAVRGGTIVGEHSIIFAGNDEIIEIKHTALSKRIFAEGALRAACFIVKQKSGLYNMKDVLAVN